LVLSEEAKRHSAGQDSIAIGEVTAWTDEVVLGEAVRLGRWKTEERIDAVGAGFQVKKPAKRRLVFIPMLWRLPPHRIRARRFAAPSSLQLLNHGGRQAVDLAQGGFVNVLLF